MKARVIILFMISLFLISCYKPPVPRTITNSFLIESSYDSVWSALIEIFAQLDLPIVEIEKDSGLIKTDLIKFENPEEETNGEEAINDDYFDCGSYTPTNKYGKINIFVKRINENSCQMNLYCLYDLRYKWGEELECISTGRLEKEIYDLVTEKIERNKK